MPFDGVDTEKKRVCWAETCHKPLFSRGLCKAHYSWLKRQGLLPPDPLRAAARARRQKVCKQCGQAFTANKSAGSEKRQSLGKGQFCSPKCHSDSRRTYGDRAAERRRQGAVRRERMGAKKWVSPAVRLELFESQEWRCYICNRETLRADPSKRNPLAPTLDHLIPLAAGGANDASNFALACRSCNVAKQTRPWFECAWVLQ